MDELIAKGKHIEIIAENSPDTDHHYRHHRHYCFQKNIGKCRAIPNNLFHHLDHRIHHPYRHHRLVLDADQKK